MTNAEQRRRLRELLRDGIISQDTYDVAISKVPEEKKIDIYNNQQGELCIILAYRNSKWTIRVPLMYEVWTYIREMYPMDNSKQGRNNRYLWKVLAENREKILELDKERKVGWLTGTTPEGRYFPITGWKVQKSENKPDSKSRVLTVAQSERW